MKRNSGLQAPWIWPVEAAHYDRTPQLKPCEVEALRVNIPLLQEGALPWEVIEKCKVPRLLGVDRKHQERGTRKAHSCVGGISAMRVQLSSQVGTA